MYNLWYSARVAQEGGQHSAGPCSFPPVSPLPPNTARPHHGASARDPNRRASRLSPQATGTPAPPPRHSSSSRHRPWILVKPRKPTVREPLSLNHPRRAKNDGNFSDPNSPGARNGHRNKSEQRAPPEPRAGISKRRAPVGTFCSLRSISRESASRRSEEPRLRMAAAAGGDRRRAGRGRGGRWRGPAN